MHSSSRYSDRAIPAQTAAVLADELLEARLGRYVAAPPGGDLDGPVRPAPDTCYGARIGLSAGSSTPDTPLHPGQELAYAPQQHSRGPHDEQPHPGLLETFVQKHDAAHDKSGVAEKPDAKVGPGAIHQVPPGT
jgi:hypothetical protein